MALLQALTSQERAKLRELEKDGHTSAIGLFREHINKQHAKLVEAREARDRAASTVLTEDELEMAKNMGLRPAEYFLGKLAR